MRNFRYTTDNSQNGKVWVNTYFDHESGDIFHPLNAGTAAGDNYLGSEHNYIIDDTTPDQFFGYSDGTLYEADLGGPPPTESTKYDFTFFYDSGDYYYGSVYAAADAYALNDVQNVTGVGHYLIQGGDLGYSAALLGEVTSPATMTP